MQAQLQLRVRRRVRALNEDVELFPQMFPGPDMFHLERAEVVGMAHVVHGLVERLGHGVVAAVEIGGDLLDLHRAALARLDVEFLLPPLSGMIPDRVDAT